MKRLFLIAKLSIILIAVSCNDQRKASRSEELFTSSAFTPAKSFTSGAEGPAVDKAGTLYAVNFDHESTVGMVTPSGKASTFLELRNKSIGNGIRFSSKGEMYIADYTYDNIL